MIHALKIHPEYFAEVLTGKKTFEVRENDRDYKTGDLLALNEYDPEKEAYTGRCVLVYADYVCTSTKYVREGFAVMSIKPCLVRCVTTPAHGDIIDCLNYCVPLAPCNPPERV